MGGMLEMAGEMLRATPLGQALGFRAEEVAPGRVVLALPYDARLVGDPATGVIHGGAISVLMDTAGGGSVMSFGGEVVSSATLNLRIDYLRPATPGQTIRATATCRHMTRHVAFVSILAHDEDAARPVAEGTGVFTVERRPAPEARP